MLHIYTSSEPLATGIGPVETSQGLRSLLKLHLP